MKRDLKGKYVKQHGESTSRLYRTWNHMRHRVRKDCKHKFTHLYFDKGIDMCKEWEVFLVFREWALDNGYNDNLEIDRIDNMKGYYPENCRFVSHKENCNNRDITIYVEYNGKLESLKMLLNRLELEEKYFTIVHRIKRGWNHQKAIDTPTRKGNYFRSNTYVQLSNEQKLKCLEMYKNGFLFTEIAKEFNSCRKKISRIVKSKIQ